MVIRKDASPPRTAHKKKKKNTIFGINQKKGPCLNRELNDQMVG